MKSQLWYFSLRTVGCFQSCWRIRMPCMEGQTVNFPAFDHDFRCFIVSAIICHSQHRLGFLRSDAISEQKWNAKLLRLHGKQKWQGTQGYSSQSLSNMHNAAKKTGLIITWITWITTQITNHSCSKSGFRSPTRWVSAPVEAPPRRASQQRPEDGGPIAPWSWRDAQQVKSAKSVKSVNDVWMMCDVRWIPILWISLEINSHPAVPCHNLTLKSTRPPWWVGLPVGCSTPEFTAELLSVGASKSDSAPDSQTPRQTFQASSFFGWKGKPFPTEIPSKKWEDGKCNPSVQGPPDSRLANLPKSLGFQQFPHQWHTMDKRYK